MQVHWCSHWYVVSSWSVVLVRGKFSIPVLDASGEKASLDLENWFYSGISAAGRKVIDSGWSMGMGMGMGIWQVVGRRRQGRSLGLCWGFVVDLWRMVIFDVLGGYSKGWGRGWSELFIAIAISMLSGRNSISWHLTKQITLRLYD